MVSSGISWYDESFLVELSLKLASTRLGGLAPSQFQEVAKLLRSEPWGSVEAWGYSESRRQEAEVVWLLAEWYTRAKTKTVKWQISSEKVCRDQWGQLIIRCKHISEKSAIWACVFPERRAALGKKKVELLERRTKRVLKRHGIVHPPRGCFVRDLNPEAKLALVETSIRSFFLCSPIGTFPVIKAFSVLSALSELGIEIPVSWEAIEPALVLRALAL